MLGEPQALIQAAVALTESENRWLCRAIVRRRRGQQSKSQDQSDSLSAPVSGVSSGAWAEHFRNIGRALAVAEAGDLEAGIPWLPPTRRVQALRREYRSESLEQWIRLSLVGVPTNIVIIYVEELEKAKAGSDLASLGVPHPSFGERYAFAGLAAAAAVAAGVCGAVLTGQYNWFAWVGTALAVLAAAGAGGVLGSDGCRRASFAAVLQQEIRRRKGEDDTGANRLRVCPTVDG